MRHLRPDRDRADLSDSAPSSYHREHRGAGVKAAVRGKLDAAFETNAMITKRAEGYENTRQSRFVWSLDAEAD